eukprot:4189764-Amphidinium_carterae.1
MPIERGFWAGPSFLSELRSESRLSKFELAIVQGKDIHAQAQLCRWKGRISRACRVLQMVNKQPLLSC